MRRSSSLRTSTALLTRSSGWIRLFIARLRDAAVMSENFARWTGMFGLIARHTSMIS